MLEVGYGRGYDARLLHELGVRRYVGIDFVAPRPDNLPDELETKTLSFAERQDLGRTFPLVLVLDVAFHVVDDEEFHVFVDNVARHASKRVYLTGLFRDARIAPHVRHRPLSAFASLGRALDIHPWRDTMLVRFERT
ncbi:hypothetical protein L6R52_24245 [Myxococcota bacterium]|nr:hypothetical protein [Myxococcota bacterium]